MAKDLVCHMEVDEKNPDTLRSRYKGSFYYFCTTLCQVQFEADPENYVDRAGKAGKKYHKGTGNLN